ncbi:MAG: mechanosensitive ion channel domain-containing protein [Pyrinomonadaceae bacterium]
MQESTKYYLDPVYNILNYKILTLGEAQITPLSVIYLIVLTGALLWMSNKFRTFLVERVLVKAEIDLGARIAIGTIVRYITLLIGFFIIIQTVGINLTALTVLAGAIGIGVGFGLQNIAGNFISGLIILFERPVKVGDRIEVGEVDGKVTKIGARSTMVRTNDNITIIVPNSKFIEENVVNWSFENQSVRFRVPVGVAYDSDLNRVKKILLEIAAENTDVLTEPKPAVRLIEFGDSSINIQLWVWTREKLHGRAVFLSALNFAIWEKFRVNDIEIPFPQSDLHIRTGSLRIGRSEATLVEKESDRRPELSDDAIETNL